MTAVAPNAAQQAASLQNLITKDEARGPVTSAEAKAILAQASQDGVQGGELALLRTLATSPKLGASARDAFVAAVDQMVPSGAPTAQLAARGVRFDAAYVTIQNELDAGLGGALAVGLAIRLVA